MISSDFFLTSLNKYREKEGRADFFPLASGLLDNGFRVEANLLILATWNFAAFRYVTKTFHIDEFAQLLEKLEPTFASISGIGFKNARFEDLREEIGLIYDHLSQIEGIKYTGASKLMHLKNPKLFVMWDSYIRGEDAKCRYKELPIVRSGDWPAKKYGKQAESYIEFLSDVQDLFAHLQYDDQNKTLAKAIDEFNYVNITLPLQDMKKAGRRDGVMRGTNGHSVTG